MPVTVGPSRVGKAHEDAAVQDAGRVGEAAVDVGLHHGAVGRPGDEAEAHEAVVGDGRGSPRDGLEVVRPRHAAASAFGSFGRSSRMATTSRNSTFTGTPASAAKDGERN